MVRPALTGRADATVAADELLSKPKDVALFEQGGAVRVRQLLFEMAQSYRSADTEPGIALALTAGGSSPWFCEAAWRL